MPAKSKNSKKEFDKNEIFNEVFSLHEEKPTQKAKPKAKAKSGQNSTAKKAKKTKSTTTTSKKQEQSVDKNESTFDPKIQEIIDELVEIATQSDNTIDNDTINQRVMEVSSEQEDQLNVCNALESRGIKIIENDEDDLDLNSSADNISYDQSDKSGKEIKNEANQDAVKTYLKDIGRIPLLGQEAEIKVAQRIAAGKIAKEKLDADENFGDLDPQKLTQSERSALESEFKDSEEARKSLAEANLRLVVSIAKKFTNRGMSFLDLIQEGNLGLLKAVDKYDYQKGFKFSTYATWWIRQAITRSIADQGRTIRIPVHMVETINKVKKASSELLNETGRDPTPEEIAKKTGLTPEKVKEALKSSQDPVSLETPIGEEEDSHLGDFIKDVDSLSPVEVADQSYQKQVIEEVLDTLADREKMVIKYRFGLIDGNCMTLEEVGGKFGVTRERIRQIEAKALRKLRHPSRSKKLKDLL